MIEEEVCFGVDIAKNILDIAVSNLDEARQFNNDNKGITSAVRYIAGLKPTRIILEATGNYEMPLAASLQSNCLPAIIVNPRQVRDFARATGVLAKTDRIDARILALFGVQVLSVSARSASPLYSRVFLLVCGNASKITSIPRPAGCTALG